MVIQVSWFEHEARHGQQVAAATEHTVSVHHIEPGVPRPSWNFPLVAWSSHAAPPWTRTARERQRSGGQLCRAGERQSAFEIDGAPFFGEQRTLRTWAPGHRSWLSGCTWSSPTQPAPEPADLGVPGTRDLASLRVFGSLAFTDAVGLHNPEVAGSNPVLLARNDPRGATSGVIFMPDGNGFGNISLANCLACYLA